MYLRTLRCLGLLLLCSFPTIAQINYTANDQIQPYNGAFGYGVNMGQYNGWTDDNLADIAIGNPNSGIQGAGVNSLRVLLPEYFLEFFGYQIREATFQRYANLGSPDNVAIIGYPTDAHRFQGVSCPNKASESFENLFLPIWDDGADGNPINEENYYAHYVYRMVDVYKDYVRFWEVQNEPDAPLVANPNVWYSTVPDPCDYSFSAPIFHYIRMLRIAYEVVHYLDPDGYVAVGGLGIEPFLDLVLRHTDNPVDGSVTADYPLMGGAYFDVMSYHSYPILDGSLRYYSNAVGGFVFERHSDRAGEAVVEKGESFQAILDQYGYDGNTFPKKLYICTETNVPRKEFTFFGTDQFQRNSAIKMAVAMQQADVKQMHVYTLGDLATESQATFEFQLKGMYKALSATQPYHVEKNQIAIGYKTMSDALKDKRYDPIRTTQLQLPADVGGAAFQENGQYVYVLWAKTTIDKSEEAQATYAFPSSIATGNLELQAWDYSETGSTSLVNAQAISLSGDPVFLKTTSSTGLICFAGVDQTICEGGTANLNATASGGFGPYSFNWEGLGGGASQEVKPTVTTTYTVEVFDNSGGSCTSQITVNVLPACGGAIGDFVFEDSNGNGIQDTGEMGVGNVSIQLSGTDALDNSISLNTTSNAAGFYSFEGLTVGTYLITAQLPGPYSFSPQLSGQDSNNDSDVDANTGQSGTILVDGIQQITSIDIGLIPIENPGLNLDCPADMVVNVSNGQTSVPVSWTPPTPTSDCPWGRPGTTQIGGPSNGSSFSLGTATIQYYAWDGCGDGASCTFTVTVQEGNDNPTGVLTISCPADIQLTLPQGASSMPVNWNEPNPNTTCPTGSINLTQGGPSNGSNLAAGSYTVQYQVTDGCDNTETCSFNITIAESASPTGDLSLSCPNNITINLEQGEVVSLVNWAVPIPNSTCSVGTVNLNQLSGPANGSSLGAGTYTVQYQATDGCNNVETCTLLISILEAAPPTGTLSLNCTANISETLAQGSSSMPVTWPTPTATSTCPTGTVNVIQTGGRANGSQFQAGTYTISYEANDGCGNIESCSFTIIVEEQVEEPADGVVLNCPDDILVSLEPGQQSATVNWQAPSATSNCPWGSVGVLQLEGPPSGSSFGVGTTRIEYYAYDGCGNGEKCEFFITVQPIGSNSLALQAIETSLIYPNPTAGQIQLNLSQLTAQEGLIELFDANSRAIGQWSWDKNAASIKELDLSHLPNGIYNLVITQKDMTPIKEKVVVTK